MSRRLPSGLALLALLAPIAAHAAPLIQPRTPETAENPERDERVSVERTEGLVLIVHAVDRTAAMPAQPLDRFRKRTAFTADQGAGRFRGVQSELRRAVYLHHVVAAEMRYALPQGLLDALLWTESRYDPTAISSAGAVGIGQLMPGTAREMGVRNRFDPIAGIDGAARYLRLLIDKFGPIHLALAAYNAGPWAVQRSGGIPRNRETPEYVRKVLRRWQI